MQVIPLVTKSQVNCFAKCQGIVRNCAEDEGTVKTFSALEARDFFSATPYFRFFLVAAKEKVWWCQGSLLYYLDKDLIRICGSPPPKKSQNFEKFKKFLK